MAGPLDTLSSAELVATILTGQEHVHGAVLSVSDALTRAVDALCEAFAAGGRFVFVGAGTPGRLALMQAAEVPATFGVDPGRIVAVTPSAIRVDVPDDVAEDDEQLGQEHAESTRLTTNDVVIAISASGSTPYTLGFATVSRRSGTHLVTITGAKPSPLRELAHVAVAVPTEREVVDGSTRLAAGTAQKIVLDILTTASMARLGHVHDRYMIDVIPANEKLRGRAVAIVADVCSVSSEVAVQALEQCSYHARTAIVLLKSGLPAEQARQIADRHRSLRDALASEGSD